MSRSFNIAVPNINDIQPINIVENINRPVIEVVNGARIGERDWNFPVGSSITYTGHGSVAKKD